MVPRVHTLPGGDTLIVSDFAFERHLPKSGFSHFEGDQDELLARVAAGMPNAVRGYRDGVLEVPVDPAGFFSSLCVLKEGDELRGQFRARRPGEAPRKALGVVGGKKAPALACNVILYHRDVLAEGDEGTPIRDLCGSCLGSGIVSGTDCPSCDRTGWGPARFATWEVVSINASPTEQATPIPPMTLLHNHFGSEGGTATNMSDSELVAALRVSMEFWRDKANAWADD